MLSTEIDQAIKKELEQHLEFGGTTRFLHWVRAFMIIFLIASGFYISYPFLQPNWHSEPVGFLQAYNRSFHCIAGFILIGASFFRVYLFFFAKSSQPERISITQVFNPVIWVRTIGAYLFIAKHPHINGAYNPLQFCTYFALGILTLIISLTGISLYSNVYHEGLGALSGAMFGWVEVVCGGLANVRAIHHIVTWAFIIFIPVHIYLVIWNSVRYPNGGADAMVSGMRYVENRRV
ncbi:Ni/Fe-hydrogenase, b-type cytochrome subunit [Helicobacter didelphidarum]|uniref:Ni/Fe-hydrogenase, b-type cytochrome subunit n=1 Tax=Helicobacter didelphidarum TaxID=2040648 RepID=A0A3D8IHX0_9HELI|nr:Ni/Fe-hydrogenase, b-type cytochrome subunit [Helicobacter didelphidarum]RDU64927.1 Ni/Fe-hydrogenase, b-type cytochrome subunit [Helicobacter didelphidarum]